MSRAGVGWRPWRSRSSPVYLVSSSLYVVREGEQALVVRLGAPSGVRPARPEAQDAVHRLGLRHSTPLAAARAAARADHLGRPEAPRGAALHALPHRRSLALLSGAAHARAGDAELTQMVSSSVRRELGQVPLLSLLTDQRGDILDHQERGRGQGCGRSASRSTKCASIAPTCRSRPARRSTIG